MFTKKIHFLLKEIVVYIITANFSYTYNHLYNTYFYCLYRYYQEYAGIKKNKCTMDQELADTAAYVLGRHCVCTHQVEALFCIR